MYNKKNHMHMQYYLDYIHITYLVLYEHPKKAPRSSSNPAWLIESKSLSWLILMWGGLQKIKKNS